MTNRIKTSDWEALSAYLDNQISAKDRSRLETRLSEEAELAGALEELRRTRVILRSQPRLRAPRNFTLTPAMAGVRRQGLRISASPFATLRLASALATIFLIVVTVGDLAVRRFSPAPTTMIAPEQAFDPRLGKGGGGGGGPGIAPPAPAMEMQSVPEEPAALSAESSEMPDAMALVVTPLSYPASTQEAAMRESPPGFESGNSLGPQTGGAVEKAAPASSLSGAVLIIRVLQVALALLAVGAGIVALLLRRTQL